MPIEDYRFENRIFFAREIGVIQPIDAEEWAQKLVQHAQESNEPIVALVDAVKAGLITMAVTDLFSKASFTPNLLAVVVATSPRVTLVAKTIGMLGKPGHTKVFPSLEAAQEYAENLLRPKTPAPSVEI